MRVRQIGVTALRGPDGQWLEQVPLYVEETPENIRAEDELKQTMARLVAQGMGGDTEDNHDQEP